MKRAPSPELPSSQRVDFWLWCARIARARTSCAALAESGMVRINRQRIEKAHAQVRVGDVLTIPGHPTPAVRVLEICNLGTRRGSPADAALLFKEIPEPST